MDSWEVLAPGFPLNPKCTPIKMSLYSPSLSLSQPASHTQPSQPAPSSFHPSILTSPVYPRDLFYFPFPEKSIHSSLVLPCYPASLGLWIIGWLSCTLLLIPTYEWVHTIFVFLSLDYLNKSDFFSVTTICLEIFWGHCFLQLSNSLSCKCNHVFLIHSSVGGNLGCFQVLAIMNNDTEQVSFGYD